VNQLLKNFGQMQKMLKKASSQGGGMQGLGGLDPSAAMGMPGQAPARNKPKKKIDRKKQKLKAKQKKKKK
ncbi:MAG: signal recognition particle protein, partial [Desulfovermiculus sp.]|nr:signal recognition particle protein [Desulfovermiculus sp.]